MEGVRFSEDDTIVISTRNPVNLYEALPRWVQEEGLSIGELRSADDSLQSLFESLLRLHRGDVT